MLALSANFGFFGVDFDEKITKKIFYSKVRFRIKSIKSWLDLVGIFTSCVVVMSFLKKA